MKHYYSFDIFDTCFVRACGSPHNIFDLLAYQVLGEKSEESLRMDFAAIRIEGERKARLHSGKKEVTLTDIYDCCSFEGLTSMDKQQIAVAEIEIEREQLVPVYSMLQKIEELHRIGESIYYISDMYLPQEFIHENINTASKCSFNLFFRNKSINIVTVFSWHSTRFCKSIPFSFSS